jgi:hypothetical protein
LLKNKLEIRFIELWLGTSEKLPQNISDKLRGYIGNKFMDDSLFHNHRENGAHIYRYPIIQYKIINGNPLIIGIGEGIQSVWKVFDEISGLNLDRIELEVFDKKSLLKQVQFGMFDKHQTYYFLTPWLALNEKNYDQYQRRGSWIKRKELLEKVLIGNIISMSKSLGYTVPGPIECNIGNLKEVQTSLKGTPMLGFLGTFSVNFEIPDYWGIGKSVSRGFGTVRRVME